MAADERSRCGCRGGCANRHCRCHKSGRACGDDCRCSSCANPFNRAGGLQLSACARRHIEEVLALTPEQLAAPVEMPCEHGDAQLGQLLDDYACPECGTVCWYSFCWQCATEDSTTWHCEACRECRDWREWHCDRCNRCTYGHSLPCERCGARSELYSGLDDLW